MYSIGKILLFLAYREVRATYTEVAQHVLGYQEKTDEEIVDIKLGAGSERPEKRHEGNKAHSEENRKEATIS